MTKSVLYCSLGYLRNLVAVTVVVAFSSVAFAQPGAIPAPANPGVLSDSFQVHLVATDDGSTQPGSVFVTNPGLLGAATTSPPTVGAICVNVYTFAEVSQQELSCCAYALPANSLANLYVPSSSSPYVIKLLATIPGASSTPGTNAGPFTGTVCNPAHSFGTANLAPGMRAWLSLPLGQQDQLRDEFSEANLTSTELSTITTQCGSLTPTTCSFFTVTIAANASVVYMTANQNVTLSATVYSVDGPVNTGTVTFTVTQGMTTIGSAVTSGTVTSGAASATYVVPGGTGTGMYTINAVYNPGGPFATSSDGTHTLSVTGMPDLTISKMHTGNFTQGQMGATYSITVANSGTAPTSGSVTVTDTIPNGLTLVSMAGTGWTCGPPNAANVCVTTTTTAQLPGYTYPAITVTVNVGLNAPASVTNTATVAGGGETNTANDTAMDQTTIVPTDKCDLGYAE